MASHAGEAAQLPDKFRPSYGRNSHDVVGTRVVPPGVV